MSRTRQLGVALRALALVTALGLGLAFEEPAALRTGILLLLAAAGAVAAVRLTPAPRWWWVHAAEGLLAGAAVGTALPDPAPLLYLLVPGVLTGLVAAYRQVLAVVGLAVLGLAAGAVVAGGAGARDLAHLVSPWAVASLGAGLVLVWARELRNVPDRDEEASYESARRLLAQLRTVARRLSSGLDPVSMAAQVVHTTHEALGATRTAAFVRTEGGVLAPLGYQGYAARETLVPKGRLVERCWAESAPVHELQAGGSAHVRHRTALPLRSGSRLIGLVLAEGPAAAGSATLRPLMEELDEQSLRLDTALVFDEVRSLATVEERQRLAREIHDGVAQEIASLGYLVDELEAAAADDPQRTGLARLRGEISRVVSELRLSIFDLRSEVSPVAGLGSALSDYVRAVGARSGLTVHLTLDEAPTRLRTEVETELLRIAQEAVTNARKHSNARNLWVDCRIRPPFARITVEDDGDGLGAPRGDSYGFRIMRERADRVNALLDIGPRPVQDGAPGTKVSVTVGDEFTADG